MTERTNDKTEQRIRFITRYYAPDKLDVQQAWMQFTGSHPVGRQHSGRRLWIGIAASILILISSGTWWLTNRTEYQWKLLEAANGQTTEFCLPDSTQVTLAPGATLRYRLTGYGIDTRNVELIGKAFFDVRRDPKAPFHVETRLADVTVLGTSFQVNQGPEEVSVNVITGKVLFAIDQVKEEAILVAGMSGVYTSASRSLKVSEEGDRNELAWKTRELDFRDTPLPEVIRTLEEYYSCKITLTKPISDKARITRLKLTATLRDLSLRDALVIINNTLKIRLTAKPLPQTKP